MLPIIYHPDYQAPLRRTHRFPMSKYGYLRDALQDRGLITAGQFLSPAPFGAAQIALAHDAAYVARAMDLTLDKDEIKRIGLPCTEQVIRRSRLSAAGTTLAALLALEHGLACNMAGGSHHAGVNFGAGFCVFNDVAVAVRNVRALGFSGSVLIVDADVHQGDGTAQIFSDDDSVFTYSVHARSNFPFPKACSDLDIELADGTEGAEYLNAFEHGLRQALSQSRPDLVFFNAGVDVHVDDRLGRLALRSEDIRSRERTMISTIRAASIPLVCVLGGGYSNNPLCLADLHAILFEEAYRAWSTSAPSGSA